MLSFQTDVEMLQPLKSKHTLLPLLTVLFLISYGLMVMLIVEQGKTIDTQRYLIRSLFSDSSQLSALRNGAIQKHNEAQAKAGTQAAPAPHGRAKNKASNVRPLPQKPPKDTSDAADERRSVSTI